MRKESGEKRSFQFDSLMDPGIAQENVFNQVAVPVINVRIITLVKDYRVSLTDSMELYLHMDRQARVKRILWSALITLCQMNREVLFLELCNIFLNKLSKCRLQKITTLKFPAHLFRSTWRWFRTLSIRSRTAAKSKLERTLPQVYS